MTSRILVSLRIDAIGDRVFEAFVGDIGHCGSDSVPTAHVAHHGFPEIVLFLRRHGEWWQGLLSSLAAFMSESREGKRGW